MRRAGVTQRGRNPLSVALIVGTASGGTGTHVRMLAEGLAARGLAVTVHGPAQTNADFGFGRIPGVRFAPVEFGDRPQLGDLKAIATLRRLFREPAALVHAHGMRAGALAGVARVGMRRAAGLVVTVHNAPPASGWLARLVYYALERVVARAADLVLCVASDLEERMRDKGARRIGRAIVPAPERPVPERPEPERPEPERHEPERHGPERHGPEPPAGDFPERPVILAAGRLAPQKGFATLLEAARDWQQMTPRPRLVIAGDGPLREELQRRAEVTGIGAEFPGRVDDVPARLRRAAVFVLPSLWEGQPLVLQEALRAGAAIVATRAGGIPDITGDGDAAILVPPGDAPALAKAIRMVLTDARMAASLRESALNRAAALPSAEEAVTRVLADYARLPA